MMFFIGYKYKFSTYTLMYLMTGCHAGQMTDC